MTAGVTFDFDIERWVGKSLRSSEQFIVASLLEIHAEIVEEITRQGIVDTGAYRAGWYANLGRSPGSAPQGAGSSRTSAEAASNDILLRLNGFKIGMVVTFTNGASYGVALEFGTGSRPARPAVRDALGRAEAIVARVGARFI